MTLAAAVALILSLQDGVLKLEPGITIDVGSNFGCSDTGQSIQWKLETNSLRIWCEDLSP